MAKPIIEGFSLGTTVLMLPLVFGLVYIVYLLVPYIKRLYNYLFAPSGGASMDVDGRPIYRE